MNPFQKKWRDARKNTGREGKESKSASILSNGSYRVNGVLFYRPTFKATGFGSEPMHVPKPKLDALSMLLETVVSRDIIPILRECFSLKEISRFLNPKPLSCSRGREKGKCRTSCGCSDCSCECACACAKKRERYVYPYFKGRDKYSLRDQANWFARQRCQCVYTHTLVNHPYVRTQQLKWDDSADIVSHSVPEDKDPYDWD